ncbi:phosphorylase [Lacihabitans sp. LS3-19]|uniref:nucleoside phosphorylase n=1 Tax=Lacihabitans sp. LS3-19 TaxID=2487335 RepID=UPI0020CC16C0|nr:nucleoside phosphorylase [Lacihabitans sp. LS3-19]MCP9767514.1 phosphorylase [Lacihabitans sp. LS3-19]
MNKNLSASELILNPDGSLYHCNLLPENLADTVLLVGDPDRVPMVSSKFDTVDFKTQKREIVTHTGTKNGKRISVISTGMGTDNIDIVLNELDAVVNIDLKEKKLKTEHKQLIFIRLGTSGSLQADIPVDSFLASTHGLGMDGLIHYYRNTEPFTFNGFVEHFIETTNWNTKHPRPYFVEADKDLIQKAKDSGFLTGVTATACGFYGPQGRVLRLNIQDTELNEKLSSFEFKSLKITNFEMETSAIFGLSKLLGHKAISINCIIANRFTKEYSKDYKKSVEEMVEKVLNNFI